MIRKFRPSLLERAKKEFWSLSPDNILYFFIILFLPTQLGQHFWPNFSFVQGLRIDYLSPTFYFTDVLIICLLVFWFFSSLHALKNYQLKISTSLVVVSTFLALGVFLSISPQAGAYGLVKLAEFCFFGFYTIKNIRNLNLIVVALSFGLIFESILAIAQYFNGGSLGSMFYFLGERAFNSQTPGIANASLNGSLFLRPYGTFSHPNVLAGYLVLVMTFVLFQFRNSTSKILKLGLLSLGTLALFLTLSRTAIIVWIVVLCSQLFKKRWKFVLGACIFVSVLIYFSPLGARFLSFNLADESISQRLSLSKAAVDMFLQKPIFGVGLNSFLANLPFYERVSGSVYYIQPAHNIFLLVLSETGIFVFGFFIWFLVKTYRKIIIDKKKTFLVILLPEILFLGLFDHYFLTLQQGQLLLALILGLSWSTCEG